MSSGLDYYADIHVLNSLLVAFGVIPCLMPMALMPMPTPLPSGLPAAVPPGSEIHTSSVQPRSSLVVQCKSTISRPSKIW